MTDLIVKIENEIFEQVCTALDNDLPEPKLKVVFSSKGYFRARHEAHTIIYFNFMSKKFMGYPYDISTDLKEDFEVVEIEE